MFNNIRNVQFRMLIIDIVATAATFTCFNTQRKKDRLFTISGNNLRSYSLFLIFH